LFQASKTFPSDVFKKFQQVQIFVTLKANFDDFNDFGLLTHYCEKSFLFKLTHFLVFV